MPILSSKRAIIARTKLFAVVATAGVLALGGTTAARALTPNVVAEVGHFVECFGWMITAPDTHADNCLPGHIPPLESLVDSGPGEDRLVAVLTDATEVAPEEIAADVALVAGGIEALDAALAAVGYDVDALAASPEAAQVTAAVNDPIFTDAGARLSAYRTQVCQL